MSEITNIGWTNSTFNPWTGCRRVSPGCLNCYMFALLKRWGRDATERRRTKDWKKVLRWNRQAEPVGSNHPLYPVERPRVFASLCDWLDNEVPIEWLADFLQLIHDTPNLDWLLLTKRPENFQKRLALVFQTFSQFRPWIYDMVFMWLESIVTPSNIWIGTSVEDQKRADERIPLLLTIPAKVRFLSVEPLLEPVKLGLNQINYDRMCHGDASTKPSIDWVIVGGESGGKRRDCGVEAIVDVANQCQRAGTACFVKQDCAFKPGQQGRIPADVWALKQPPNFRAARGTRAASLVPSPTGKELKCS